MTTPEMIPRIETAFGFPLYSWQKEYLSGKMQHRAGGRHNGRTFAYCVKLLLSDGEPIGEEDLHRYIDELRGSNYPRWFAGYCMDINQKLVEAGFETRIR